MKIFSRILLLFCLPAFLLSPIPSVAFSFEQKTTTFRDNAGKAVEIPRDEFGRVNPWVPFRPENLSINHYFQFIDLTENQAFLESLTEEEFDIVVDFVTKMFQASAPEDMPDLQEQYELEVDELMEDLYGETKLKFSLNQTSILR